MNWVKWEITAGRRNGQYGNGNGTITVTGDNGKGRLTVAQPFFCFTFDGSQGAGPEARDPAEIISEYPNMTKKKNL